MPNYLIVELGAKDLLNSWIQTNNVQEGRLGSAQMGPFPVKVAHFLLGKHTYITNSFNSLLCVKCEVRMSLYNFSMQKGFAKSGRAPQFPSMLRLSLLSSSLHPLLAASPPAGSPKIYSERVDLLMASFLPPPTNRPSFRPRPPLPPSPPASDKGAK